MLEKFLKKSSWTDIVASAIFIILGIMLITNPGTIMSVISIVLGGMCIVIGVLRAIDYYSNNKQDNYLLAIAIVAIIAGIIIMFCAGLIASAFRIIIGIWIIYSGIMNFQTTIVWKDSKGNDLTAGPDSGSITIKIYGDIDNSEVGQFVLNHENNWTDSIDLPVGEGHNGKYKLYTYNGKRGGHRSFIK